MPTQAVIPAKEVAKRLRALAKQIRFIDRDFKQFEVNFTVPFDYETKDGMVLKKHRNEVDISVKGTYFRSAE